MTYCSGRLCNKAEHKKVISNLYKNIINILRKAAISSYKPSFNHKKRKITGWNKYVSTSHERARLCFQEWVCAGKPRYGGAYDEMANSRKVFKSKLKWCQDHEEQIKMDIMATSYETKHFGKFWQHTNRLRTGTSLPAEVGGISGRLNIANMFKTHFNIDPCRKICKTKCC